MADTERHFDVRMMMERKDAATATQNAKGASAATLNVSATDCNADTVTPAFQLLG